MKKFTALFAALLLCFCLAACTSGSADKEASTTTTTTTTQSAESHEASTAKPSTQEATTKTPPITVAGSFTNKYGTADTKCVKSGCDNFISSSGDTNCCVIHSNNCLECKKYIDGDAMYCMDCLKGASGNSNSNSSSGKFTNKYGTASTKCVKTGCNNYIASSGDTNCCVTHSSKCLQCKQYIDSDAMYCLDCIKGASANNAGTFSNKYGTSSTKCAKSGCNNYIATSGDTNCCVTHSNKCLECKKYIDGDAVYCMDCIKGAYGQTTTKSYQTTTKSYGYSSGNTCKYKSGGQYVCSKAATNGNFCKYHYDYLNDAYNDLFG